MFQLRRPISRKVRKQTRPAIEALENRLLLTTNSWKAAVSGDWDTASNWSLGHVPTSTEDAVISIAGTYSVTHSVGDTDSVHSITSSKPLTFSSGTLIVGTTLTTTGAFTLSGGTLQGATITVGTGGSFAITSGYFNNVTLGSNLTISSGSSLYVYQNLNLNGHSLTLAAGASGAYLYLYDVSGETVGPTLSGTGQVIFGGTNYAGDTMYAYSSTKVGTISAGVTLEGAGNINVGYGSPGGLTNSGTILANVSGQTLTIQGGGAFTNTGTASATGGGILTLSGSNWLNNGTLNETSSTLNLGGAFTKSGNVTRTAGNINLIGTYNLGGGTLAFTATTGSWNLVGGTLQNAVMTNAGGAGLLLNAGNTGYLNDVTLGANFVISAGSYLYIYQTLNLKTFSLTLAGAASGAYLYLYDVSGETVGPTISGTGQVIFGGTNYSGDTLYAYSSTKVGTISAGVTVEGAGNIYVGYGSPGGLINSGTILANVSGQTLNIGGGGAFTNKGTASATGGGILTLSGTNWLNSGTLNETSSTLNLGGTFTKAGNVTRTAGNINLIGTYNAGGATLAFTATTGSWNLVGGTLQNAVMTNAGGAGLLLNTGAGYFNDVTLGANFVISAGSELFLYQTLNLKAFSLTLAGGASGASLYLYDVSGETVGPTLSGTGKVIFGGTNYAADNMYAYSSTKVGTISAGVTVEGAGNINVGYGSPGGLTNSGTILANVSGQTLNIQGGGTFSNKGTITVSTGATLGWSDTSATNSGTISGNGTIVGNVTNNGVINAGSPFGTLTIKGNLTEGASSSIRVELGGTTTATYNKLVVTGTAALAGILDIYELNSFKPAIGNTFTVFTYASHTGTLGTDGTSLSGGTVALSPTIGTTSASLKGIAAPADTTAPKETAFKAGAVTKGAASFTFTVTFSDNIAIDVATLGSTNIKITGPGGFSVLATLVSVNKTNNGLVRTATYKITPPGGTWDVTDNGTYTVAVQANSVKDTKGNAVAAGTIGTFLVNLT